MLAWPTSAPTHRAATRASSCCAWPTSLPATVTQAISDLASLADLASLTGAVAVLQRRLLRIRRP
jgi:hypothetical protein